MSSCTPPFTLTDQMTSLTADIVYAVAQAEGRPERSASLQLRRENRIRTIHSSLAIENNSMSLEQVTAILDGKHVLGPPMDIIEVQNAGRAYDLMLHLDPSSTDDLLKAHAVMMRDLVQDSGRFRTRGVAVWDEDVPIHIAPPAQLVPGHIENLFDWYRRSELHPLIKSAVFHYEFEFIHPFMDGNGRMGRMWHSLLLGTWNRVFFWLPVDEMIRARQSEYYAALGATDKMADSAVFVELMLEIILDALLSADTERAANLPKDERAHDVPDRTTGPFPLTQTDLADTWARDEDSGIDQDNGGTDQVKHPTERESNATDQDRKQIDQVKLPADQKSDKTDQDNKRTDQVGIGRGLDNGSIDQVRPPADHVSGKGTVSSDGLSGAETDNAIGNDTPVGRLICALADETLSAAELMRRLGLSHRPTFRRNYLVPAMRMGLIERTIPDSRRAGCRSTAGVHSTVVRAAP